MINECGEHSEFSHLSMDATVRVAMRLKGQANYRASKATRQKCLFPDGEAKRAVLTLRGRTGAVVGMWLTKDETSENCRVVLEEHFPIIFRQQVIAFFVDAPSGLMFTELQVVFNRLVYLCLDPVHLVIVYLQSHNRKATKGCKYLRVIMNKLNKVSSSFQSGSWGPVYRGFEDVELTHPEEHMRAHITKGTLLHQH